MSDVHTSCQEIRFAEGRAHARFRRDIDHSPETVWAALTEPGRICDWLAPGRIELVPGGAVRLDFGDSGIVIDSTVSDLKPGEVLEYSWSGPGQPQRPLRWTVSPRPGGATLELELSEPDDEDIARSCAGFDAHLDMLEAALEGAAIRFPFPQFVAYREAYKGMAAAGRT